MSFSTLPLELVYQVADYLEFEKDINALVRTDRHFYSTLNRYLYRHHVKHWEGEALMPVCEFGDSTTMRMFLDEGMPVGASDIGWNSITLAASLGYDDIVKWLLESGVDPNAQKGVEAPWAEHFSDSNFLELWSGPFDLAAESGFESTVRLLAPHMRSVDYSVTPESEEYNKTPLTLAASTGQLNVVKMLVEELRCNVEPTRPQGAGEIIWMGMSPLAHAACKGHTDTVRYLLSVGANPNSTIGGTWCTLLENPVMCNNLEVTKTLIEHGANPDPFIWIEQAKSIYRREEDRDAYIKAYGEILFPLICASSDGHKEMVELILQYVSLERVLERGVENANILVPVAAASGLDSMVKRLLEAGCDVNACFTTTTGSQVYMGNGLSFASQNGHTGIARILLDHGADPNVPETNTHRKPLVEAVNADRQDVVGLLLDAGADPNTTYGVDESVLSAAAKSEPMFRMLLNRGANPSALKPEERQRLFKRVLDSRDVSIMRTLLDTEFGLSIVKEHWLFKRAIVLAAEAETAMFEFMLQYLWHQHGLKPGPQNYDWYLAIESAIRCRNAEGAEILLERYGLKFGYQNMADYLPLAAGVYHDPHDRIRAEPVFDVLLRNGADVNARQSNGHTCLSLAMLYSSQQQAKLAIDYGAKYPLTHADSGRYLLTGPARSGNFELLELLLGWIDAQGISSEDIEPHLQQAQANLPAEFYKLERLRVDRALQHFRCRRKYPVPER